MPSAVWEEARAATPSVFTEPDFLRAVEHGLPNGARLDHVVITLDGPAGRVREPLLSIC